MILKALSPTICAIALDRRSKRRFPIRMGMWFRPAAGQHSAAEWTAGESLNVSSTGLLFSGPDAVLPGQALPGQALPGQALPGQALPGQRIEALIDWPVPLKNRGDLRLALEGVIVRSIDAKTAMRVEHYEFRLSNATQEA
jgi:hypothetical protein